MPADAEPMDQRLGGSTNFHAILGREELNNSSMFDYGLIKASFEWSRRLMLCGDRNADVDMKSSFPAHG